MSLREQTGYTGGFFIHHVKKVLVILVELHFIKKFLGSFKKCTMCWLWLKNTTFEKLKYTGWYIFYASQVAQVKNLPARQEMWVRSLDWEDCLEEEMATHSSILAWKIPWTEEVGGLQSMGLKRVRHDLMTKQQLQLICVIKTLFQWQ